MIYFCVILQSTASTQFIDSYGAHILCCNLLRQISTKLYRDLSTSDEVVETKTKEVHFSSGQV